MTKMDRKLETKTVKDALKAAGINAKVGHGTGTAWGWLEINVGNGSQFNHTHMEDHTYPCNCEGCKKIHAIAQRAMEIAQEVTGRHGEYHGEISVLTQDHWNASKKQSEEILQPV